MIDETQPRELTRFEREIDAARFNPREIVSYRPVEQVCECGRKHFGWSSTCSWCVGAP